MNNKLIKVLIAVCVVLGLVIAGEWLFASYTQNKLLTSINADIPHDYKADSLPSIELTEQSEDSYVDLVARPLFIKGRRPVDEPSPEAEQAAAATSAAFDWQLSGIYGKGKKTSALFSRSKSKAAKDNFRKITEGDELDGWKLTAIKLDKVIFKQGGTEKELLLRKPKLKNPVPRGVTPTVPGATLDPNAAPEPAADTTENINEETPEGNQ